MSNVLPYDPGAGRGSRIRFEVDRNESGKVIAKRRVTRYGTLLHELTRADRGGQ